ncbi:3-keto-disaccharide hydrolase [Sphingobacterium hungaricum]
MKYSVIILGFAALIASCSSSKTEINTLSDAEKEEGWELLFDGKTLTGWHVYNLGDTLSKWEARDGELACDPKNKGVFGDIITDKEYKDFELLIDWKVSKGGNSGVLINVNESPEYAATFATGLEMQLLDNTNSEHRHQIDSTHWAGCLYAVSCYGTNSKPKPFGEWNESKIVQKNNQVSFWLNGALTFEGTTGTQEWADFVKSTNMKNYPAFGTFSSGKIALQNHTDFIAFRNIKIREI